ncbi:hypothetical protein Poly24_15720 [Rosistilla carotiformis]|uniref:Uncharacterized protein n=1 Tax=Rosistilla carotiformis TaxID=2528017 RepID=A0A518JQP6_9BACT|nr:hypothetical protein [Rosistilla carotiformis]QDV67867.1 hypothetical protein Poly24_15720 [Rosistilla carotiformis]
MKSMYSLTIAALLFTASLPTANADDGAAPAIPVPPAPAASDTEEAPDADAPAEAEADAAAKPADAETRKPGTHVKVESKDGETTIVVRSFGKVIHVGPGGQVDVSDLPGVEVAEGEEVDGDSPRRGIKRRRVLNLSKIMQLGDDGILKELDALPVTISTLIGKSITSDAGVEGEIQVIGPDGKEFNFDFEELAPAGQELAKSIEQAIIESGVEIPADVAVELMKAKQRIEKQVQTLRNRAQQQVRLPAAAQAMAAEQKTMHEKLDRILNRLDKLETEVAAMKKQAEL